MFPLLTVNTALNPGEVNGSLSIDFSKARAKATRHHWLDLIRQRETVLPDLAEALDGGSLLNQHDCGIRVVETQKIIGSVGRTHDFDRSFMPMRDDSKERWLRIDNAVRLGSPLPPVELIKVGDDYYVEDGNHRVSVAYFHNQMFLEAHVREIMLN